MEFNKLYDEIYEKVCWIKNDSTTEEEIEKCNYILNNLEDCKTIEQLQELREQYDLEVSK